MLMATTQSHLEALLPRSGSLAEVVSAVNDFVCAHSGPREFVTLWAARVDPDGRGLTCIDAGHGYAVLIGDDGPATVKSDGGLPLGVARGSAYKSTGIGVHGGERLVLFSDGVPEQVSPAGEAFGLDRVLGVLRGSASPNDDATMLLDELGRYACADGFADDVSVISTALPGPSA
jgi:sigma-B regulation protein RsbU (phosphoserine phosphatase)